MPFKTRISQRFTERSVNDFLLKELLDSHRLHGQLREVIWELEAENDRLMDLLTKSEDIGRVDRNYIRFIEGFWSKLKNLLDGSFKELNQKLKELL